MSEETQTLTEALTSLGLTPAQIHEAEIDEERSWGILFWLREQSGGPTPAARSPTNHRPGWTAPAPKAWRGNTPGKGPACPTLLRCTQALVTNTGHEYWPEDLEEELDRISRLAQVGNGATPTA